jgi:hypothetical protein
MMGAGHAYLVHVLSKPINDIFTERKNCELDPDRYESSKRGTVDFAANRRNLLCTQRPCPIRPLPLRE